MTKQEIEKMFNTCNNYHSCALCPYNPEDISRFIGYKWVGGCPNYDRKLVYAMSKGYHKAPDNAVVLTDIDLADRAYEISKRAEDKTRKETAKDILSDLLDLHNIVQDINQKTDFYYSIEQLIVEIEIKYGIEVE